MYRSNKRETPFTERFRQSLFAFENIIHSIYMRKINVNTSDNVSLKSMNYPELTGKFGFPALFEDKTQCQYTDGIGFRTESCKSENVRQ